MKETFIREHEKPKLASPTLIVGLPGLGLVGKIATRYLIKQLKARSFARLYSPHFPYFVLVDAKGSVRLLNGTFSFWKNEKGNDLILFMCDSQAQTVRGQYEVAAGILNFAEQYDTKLIVTIGGYRREVTTKPAVLAAATTSELLTDALKSGAIKSLTERPIVGIAGLLLGLARFKEKATLCLLGETRGYLPDPKAAKSVLEVLITLLGTHIPLKDLDKEIANAEKTITRLQKIETNTISQIARARKEKSEKAIYIS